MGLDTETEDPLGNANRTIHERLGEAGQLYYFLFEQSPDGILLIDANGTIIEFNEAAHRHLGYTRDEFMGLHLSQIDPFQSAEEIEASLKKVLESGIGEFEVRHKAKSGEIRDIKVITQVMTLAGHTVFHSIWRDITEHKHADQALAQSNAILHALINAMPDMVVFKDLEGRHLVVNKGVEEFTGLQGEALIGKTNEDLLPPSLAEYCNKSDERAIRSATLTHAEELSTGANGKEVFLDTIKTTVRDPQGNLVGLVAVSRDVTERKQMEERLRESETRYRALFEGSPDAIFLADPETGLVLDANASACTLTGRGREEIIGLPQWRLHPSSKEALGRRNFQQHVSETRARGATHLVDIPVLRADGTEVPVEILAQSVPIKGKEVLMGVFRDVTERRLMKASLRKSEEFIRNILEAVDEGFIVVDRDYRILSANKAYLDQVGMALEEVVGRHCHQIAHHAADPCCKGGNECPVKRTFESGQPHRSLHVHHDADKNLIYLERKSYPLRDESNNTVSAIETISDVTEKMKLEEQLRHAQKLEAVGRLAGGIAHDFNNILSVIIGYCDLMETKLTDVEQSKYYLRQMLSSAQRAVNLTQGLLSFSRKQKMLPASVRVNKIVGDVESLLRRLIGEDVELIVDLADEEMTVMADTGHIEQALINLAINARDAMSGRGTLTIRTEAVAVDQVFVKTHGFGEYGMHALIAVTDTGCGIDETVRERIFEPFFTTKDVGKGTGLGLSIAYGIVRQHGGHIMCHSEAGKGSTFKIYLPVAEAPSSETEDATPVPTEGGTETVLIAEDDAAVRAVVREALEQSGYSVLEARDGEEAINVFARNGDEIRLLILDVMMPGKNGKEVFEAVRKQRADIKAIFLSGYSADILDRKGLAEEDAGFIAKPVSPSVLSKAVRQALDKSAVRKRSAD